MVLSGGRAHRRSRTPRSAVGGVVGNFFYPTHKKRSRLIGKCENERFIPAFEKYISKNRDQKRHHRAAENESSKEDPEGGERKWKRWREREQAGATVRDSY